MLWVIGTIVVLSITSSLLTTTAEERAEARAKVARWNPLFIAIIIAGLAMIFYPWPPPR